MLPRTLLLVSLVGLHTVTGTVARPGRFYRGRRPIVVVPTPRRRTVVRAPALSSSQLAFHRLDSSGDGALDARELLRLASTPGPNPRAGDDPLPLRLARVMDRNGDGAASAAEQSTAASAILASLDRDRDGRLNYYEYLELQGNLGWLRQAVQFTPMPSAPVPVPVVVPAANTRVPISRYDLNRDGRVTLPERDAVRAADIAELGGLRDQPLPAPAVPSATAAQLEVLEAEASAAEARAAAARARLAAAQAGSGLQ